MSKHYNTLTAIFATPTRANIKWADIISLLRHEGAEITEGSGSRVRVAIGDRVNVLHKPHPRPDTAKGAVEAVRDLLEQAGITP
ncbi:MAG: type II toxin-antitoxin system HicA family toxin [Pirellulales bacterium]